jgi:hypothetical protein
VSNRLRRERFLKHTTVYFCQVGQEREDGLVAERDEDDTVVSQRREGGVYGHLLSTTRTSSGNECASVFAREATISPDTACGIPEDLSRNFESALVNLIY